MAILEGGTYAKKDEENLPQKSESGTYAKKREETSHRNSRAGHMPKKTRKPPTEIPKWDIIRKKICICPNKRKMRDIVERKSSICPASYLSLPERKIRLRALTGQQFFINPLCLAIIYTAHIVGFSVRRKTDKEIIFWI